MRDDFPEDVKRAIASRVAKLCSNPEIFEAASNRAKPSRAHGHAPGLPKASRRPGPPADSWAGFGLVKLFVSVGQRRSHFITDEVKSARNAEAEAGCGEDDSPP